MEIVSISYFGKQVVLIRENITNTVFTSKPVGIFNHLNIDDIASNEYGIFKGW